MATNFFWIGYHFEEFRSQVAIRKKKLISRPESLSSKPEMKMVSGEFGRKLEVFINFLENLIESHQSYF